MQFYTDAAEWFKKSKTVKVKKRVELRFVVYEAVLQIFPTLLSLPLNLFTAYWNLNTYKLTDCDSKSFVEAKPTNLLYSPNYDVNGLAERQFATIQSPCVPYSTINVIIQKRGGEKTMFKLDFGRECKTNYKPRRVFSLGQPDDGTTYLIYYDAQLAEAGTYDVSFTKTLAHKSLHPPCQHAVVTLKS